MTHAAVTEGAALSRDLADFLVELSIAIHKHAIYPAGHPLLETAVAGVERRLDALLRDRSTLALGVARHQLIIEGVATEESHPLLRELASRLHRHHLGAVRFARGVTRQELGDALRTLAVDSWRTDTPLGLRGPEVLQCWSNVRLFPLSYGQLELLGGGDEKSEDEMQGARAAQLWIGLARAALASELGAGDEAPSPSTDPVVVAKAIDEHSRDTAYDQVVVGYLLQIAEELKSKQGKEALALQRRISRLVGELKPETLRRLLDMGGDFAQRRRFVLDAAQGLAVDTVMDLVQAAASSSNQTISHSMVRLLSKFAAHAELGSTPPVRGEAASALREHVGQLISDWSLDDPNPDGYRRALDGMSRAAPLFAAVDQAHPCEPERLMQMALEVGAAGDGLWRAVDSLLGRGQLGALLDALERAPAGGVASDSVWEHIAAPERLYALLESPAPDLPLIERLVARLGYAAVVPLVDALEAAAAGDGGAGDSAARPLADFLVSLGADAGPVLAARARSACWRAQRALLAVLARLPETPAGFDAGAYARHPDAEVRREALKLLAREPETREAGVCAALADADERLVRGGMTAALADCPRAAVRLLIWRADDPTLSAELRALAVSVLAGVKSSSTRDWLLHRVLAPKRRFRRAGLAPKSPEMLAALGGLAARWRDDAVASPVLALATRSDDPDIRAILHQRSHATPAAVHRQ